MSSSDKRSAHPGKNGIPETKCSVTETAEQTARRLQGHKDVSGFIKLLSAAHKRASKSKLRFGTCAA